MPAPISLTAMFPPPASSPTSSALIGEVNKGRHRSEDVLLLRRDLLGPPSIEMAGWQVGFPATLYTYALEMISISDNTATDHLLYLLGRGRVEEQMQAMGHSDPAVNRPLLSIRETVVLRDRKAVSRAEKWRKLDEADRRKFLQAEIAGLHDFEAMDFATAALGVAEWYATPLDTARALDWIRRHTGPGDVGRPLPQVMSVDDGRLELDRKTWPVVACKGGSEDQLPCGNRLLRHENGKWYTFHLCFRADGGNQSKPEAQARGSPSLACASGLDKSAPIDFFPLTLNNAKGKLEREAVVGVANKMFAVVDAAVK